MFRNYLKTAFRNILKYKGFSFLNIIGLSIGLLSCLFIFLYVSDELSYDRYHEKADRIFRVTEDIVLEGVGEYSASMPFPAGPTLPHEFPENIESAVRFFNFQAPIITVEYNSAVPKRFNEKRFFFADSNLLDMFSFELVRGNRATALDQPNSLLITESMASKYFGSDDPMGKVLKVENRVDCIITGVLKDVPHNSHFQFDFMASFSTLKQFYRGRIPQTWYWNPCWTYILLKEGTLADEFEKQIQSIIPKYFPEVIRSQSVIGLQPLTDIHLHSNRDYEIIPNSDIAYVYIFSGIAIFVLLVACINFMNLTTARSASRSKEVGMRKALGAYREQLVKQFLGESMFQSFIATLFALFLVLLFMPLFNNLSGKELSALSLLNVEVFAGLVFITLFAGLLAGIYPAFILSSFLPGKVLRGSVKNGIKNSIFRKILVITQFVISIVLIIGTTISYDQLDFLREKNLGFDKDRTIIIQAFRTNIPLWYNNFKDIIKQDSRVAHVTATEEVIGNKFNTDTYQWEGGSDKQMQIPRLFVLHDFIETFNLKMISGRSYTTEFTADSANSIIINESAAKIFGWTPEEALGKGMNNQDNVPMRVVGVVKDFNFTSLHEEISPFLLDLPNNRFDVNFLIRYVAVKLKGNDIPGTISMLEQTWKSVLPNRPFEYFFLDDDLDKLYEAEEKMGGVMSVFSFLAILIACLGLYSLVSFTAEQRTKEIGIRKVLGASVSGIVLLLSKEFIILVAAANIISWPIAYLIMENWLGGFAYRISINPALFIVAALAAILIAQATVSYQTIKAARSNPIDSIKFE